MLCQLSKTGCKHPHNNPGVIPLGPVIPALREPETGGLQAASRDKILQLWARREAMLYSNKVWRSVEDTQCSPPVITTHNTHRPHTYIKTPIISYLCSLEFAFLCCHEPYSNVPTSEEYGMYV